MDDVGAEGHVHRDRNPQAMCGKRKASVAMREIATRQIIADGVSEAAPALRACADRLIQADAGLFGHAEASRSERFVHIFGRGAKQRNLEVMDDSRAIERQRRLRKGLKECD